MDDFFFFFYFDEETNTTTEVTLKDFSVNESFLEQFDHGNIRMVWHKQDEKWYFSIVDVVQVLTDSDNPQIYWRVLKKRLLSEGNETVTNCNGLKLMAKDGKMRKTDVADSEQLLRLVQSIPSPKAEPFKAWLAKVGSERLDEIADPEIAINRALDLYRRKGYSEGWINQRLKAIETRKGLTDEWDRVGIRKGPQFAALTDEMTKAWSGMTTREYKDHKGLKKENLRDNMSNLELILNMLAEATTTELSKIKDPEGFRESMDIAREGGSVAGNTRKDIEERTGQKIVSPLNANSLNQLDDE